VLTDQELNQIIKQIERLYEISDDVEITLEANPDDLTQNKINELAKTPINRFSIGVQSFFDEDLRLMNRAHNAQEADASIKRSQDAGFENITIDLIYGSPTTSDAMWKANLDKAVDLQVPHISSYALTIEPKTVLKHQIKVGKVQAVDDEKQQNQFKMLVETLTQHGFEHYEISNFGKSGFHSKHNSAYWLGKPYVGVGPSAHSFDLKSRSWNIANNTNYIKEIFTGNLPQETEILSPADILNELTMIGLRTVYGIDLEYLEKLIPGEILLDWRREVNPLLSEGKLIEKENKIFLNPDFRFFADGIASQLFIV
ncbi:MAG: radical SAM family heme chaperone HemW, partial [Weeksellaceae bacterium]